MFMQDPFIGKPIRNVQMMLRLLAQEDPQLLPLIPDGIYGKDTMHSVSAYQKKAGLPVTGVVNEATWQAIQADYAQAWIRMGPAAPLQIYLGPGQIIDASTPNEHVWIIQAMLHVIGQHYENIPMVEITGIFDELTQSAVLKLQSISDLHDVASGAVDKKTWKYLTQLYRLCANDGQQQPNTVVSKLERNDAAPTAV